MDVGGANSGDHARHLPYLLETQKNPLAAAREKPAAVMNTQHSPKFKNGGKEEWDSTW